MFYLCQVKFTLEQTTNDQTGEQMYSSTLSLISVLDGGWVVSATPRPVYPRERPGTHCIGGWAPGTIRTGAENLAPPPGFDPFK